MESVVIRRQGNVIDISADGIRPPSPSVRALLEETLSWKKRCWLSPEERRQTGTSEKIRIVPQVIFAYDELGRLATCAGFITRITRILAERNVLWKIEDWAPEPSEIYTPNLDFLSRWTLRKFQDKALTAVFANRGGLIQAPTGFGKMALIVMTALGFANATVDIVSRRVEVVASLKRYLDKYIDEVGQTGGGFKKLGPRVNVWTADSMHKARGQSDILLVDEAHELLSDRYAGLLSRWSKARRYAFSASPTGRFDGAEIRLEALFGPPIFVLSYKCAADNGLVAPIRVKWLDPFFEFDPVGGTTNDTEKKRRGIWTHEARNRAFADEVLKYPDQQTLILVDTVAHIAHLKPFLPDFQPVFASCEDKDVTRWRKAGLIGDDWPEMNKKIRTQLRDAYERGDLRKVIATGVWAVGVDFRHLQVMARADGGASEVASIQLPGRVARINEAIGKQYGLLIDSRDRFNVGFERKAATRARHYRAMEWEQQAGDTPCPIETPESP